MIKSMTAFASATFTQEPYAVEVTLRSYNSRHLDFSIYLPEACQPFEEDVKKLVARFHDRGRIEIRLGLTDQSKDPDLFEVDGVKAQAYYKALKTLQETLNLAPEISLDHILAARNIIVPAKKVIAPDLLWQVVSKAVETGARELDHMRRQEGENLFQDLKSRMDYIESQMEALAKEAKEIPLAYKQRLEERLAGLTADVEGIDPVRLAQEVAILADKSDVSEEMVRLASHIILFREVLEAEQSQGRKLNFLIQEFNREFNTIGSKAGNARLSHRVVDLKSELEKIREQVQNIE